MTRATSQRVITQYSTQIENICVKPFGYILRPPLNNRTVKRQSICMGTRSHPNCPILCILFVRGQSVSCALLCSVALCCYCCCCCCLTHTLFILLTHIFLCSLSFRLLFFSMEFDFDHKFVRDVALENGFVPQKKSVSFRSCYPTPS